jgi:hypothetical protein
MITIHGSLSKMNVAMDPSRIVVHGFIHGKPQMLREITLVFDIDESSSSSAIWDALDGKRVRITIEPVTPPSDAGRSHA